LQPRPRSFRVAIEHRIGRTRRFRNTRHTQPTKTSIIAGPFNIEAGFSLICTSEPTGAKEGRNDQPYWQKTSARALFWIERCGRGWKLNHMALRSYINMIKY
jgi:hypothetical protein